MRIALVSPYDPGRPGGVQQVVRELADRLAAGGDEVTVVAPGRRGLDSGWSVVGRPVTVRANQSNVPLTLSPAAWLRVRRALSLVDVVHVHEPFVPVVGWAAVSARRPTVATFHADPPASVRRLYRALRRPAARMMRSLVITAVSEVAASPLPTAWGPVEIIPNAVDLAAYRLGLARLPNRVVFVGRDEPRKGLEVLLAAWPMVRRHVRDAELVAVGPDRGDEVAGVRPVGRLGEEEKRRVLSSAAVLAAPNLAGESFGLVLLEAMAAGCVVVASDLPAFRSVSGDAAVLVPPGDPAALAQALVALLADQRWWARMAERAALRVEGYDWPAVVERYRALYRRALGGRAGPAGTIPGEEGAQ